MLSMQTAKNFQDNDHKYQDNIKNYPNLENKRKTQKKSVKFQIDEEQGIKSCVTRWQEAEKQDRVQQEQELEKQDLYWRGSQFSS